MINIEHVSKQFGSLQVLEDISINIDQGDIFGIIGQSGAGKSTLLRCINGLEKYNGGSITVEGKEIAGLSQKELQLVRKDMGMIFQNFNLLGRLNVYDNIALPLQFWGQNKNSKENHDRIMELLDLVGLKDKVNSYPKQLSGGQKQRVAIARALVLNPKILLCDEATSALDPQITKGILALLLKINKELGITIVVITHEMQVIKDICDRVAVMKDGRVVETGTVFDIFANPKEQITREFVENTSNMSRIYELVETKSPVVELKPGEAILRFRYLERNVSEALVSQLSRKFNLDLNIIFGSIELIGENPIGGLVVIAQGTSDNINQAIQYLKDKNVGVEVIENG